MKFGGTLKNLRNEKGFTQDELAQKLSLAKSTISLYESGKREPDYKTIKAIAKFFNVTTDYLLGASEEKTGKADIHFVLTDGRTINDLNEMLNELTPDDQQLIFNMIESLSKRMKK